MALIDLHAHYPMQFPLPSGPFPSKPAAGQELAFWAANMLLNFQAGVPRVSMPRLTDCENYAETPQLAAKIANGLAQRERLIAPKRCAG